MLYKRIDRVFVYGTLMKGQCNHHLLETAGIKYLGRGRVNGIALYHVTSFYPGAIPEKGEYALGELYEVPGIFILDVLDELEDNGFLYQREKLPVFAKNSKHKAWTYIWLKRRGITPGRKVITRPWTPISRIPLKNPVKNVSG